jgi:hypothetical protein
MSLLENLAGELARDALALARAKNDEGLVDEVSKVLGDTSATLQEAYLTAIRVYRAEFRAREFLAEIAGDVIALPPVASGTSPEK